MKQLKKLKKAYKEILEKKGYNSQEFLLERDTTIEAILVGINKTLVYNKKSKMIYEVV